MRYAIAVVDDAQRDRESIRALALVWVASSGHGADVRGFPSAESFLFYGGAYDILLLDVEMEGASGLDLARQLREAANRAEIPVLGDDAFPEIDTTRIGLKGSPTHVKKTFVPQKKTGGIKIKEETNEDAARKLFQLLSDAHII